MYGTSHCNLDKHYPPQFSRARYQGSTSAVDAQTREDGDVKEDSLISIRTGCIHRAWSPRNASEVCCEVG